MNSKNDEEQAFVKLSYETSVYREQLKLLEREIQRIQLTGRELKSAVETCENAETGDALVPIGGGAFIRATTQSDRALVPIGANYLVDMGREKAVLELHKRIDATNSAVEKLRDEYQKIVSRLQHAGGELQQMQNRLALNRKVDENIGEDYI